MRPGDPIDHEEIAWARECIDAGDSVEDLATASRRPAQDWAALFPHAPRRPTVARLPLLMAAAGRPNFIDWSRDHEALFSLALPDWKRPRHVKVTKISTGTRWEARFRTPDSRTCVVITRVVHPRGEAPQIASQSLFIPYFVTSTRAPA